MILISSQWEQQEICHFSCTEKKTELDRYLIISDSTGPRTWVVRYPGPSCCHSIPPCHQLCCYRIWPGEFTQWNLGMCSLPERKVSKGCLSCLTLFIQWAPGSTISSKKRERHWGGNDDIGKTSGDWGKVLFQNKRTKSLSICIKICISLPPLAI